MKYPFFDFLSSALIPVLSTDVAAGTAGHIHLALVGVAALGADPDQLAVHILDLDLTVIAAALAVVGLGVQLCVHDVVVDELHHLQHGRNVLLHVGNFHIADGAAGAQLLEICLKAQLGEVACSFLCTAYLRKQNYEEAWKWLEKSADFAIHMDTYDFDAPHTSPILRGYSSGGWIMEAEGNRSQSMLNWLTTDDEAAVLRADPRYETLVARLKAVAKKP